MKQRMRARFRLRFALQVLALLASLSLLAYTLLTTDHIAVPIVIGCVVLLQVVLLLHSVEEHVATLEEFFAAVNYEDFTRRFVTDNVDAELKAAFNRILRRFQDTRADREVQASYLRTVVQHVPVALLAASEDGSLRLVNNPARRLTGLPQLAKLADFARLDPALPDMLKAIEPGRQCLLQTHLHGIPVELRVAVTEIRVGGVTERLFSIENLSGELTARESSAWRNLIRVLTHEIMNTLTPVTSLAHTCEDLLEDPAARDDIRDAVATIARRSEGLMAFVSNYRELLKLPQPNFADVALRHAFDGVVRLMTEAFAAVDIDIDVVPVSLTVQADASLLDQVLLNLLRNAADALSDVEKPLLNLSARLQRGRVVVHVRDNGSGIAANVREQVFVPFFTTKRDGSGIGLSLCRQIMTAHGGQIAVASDEAGTVVSLVF